ncbi:Transposon Ty3-I Gag-Pol poly [Clarias magur]|uniref:Transposon Ty3-I Gag-Pol poly n=1 Tax=Clarias magur TaxID=1594786 RepID=A0A8J4X7P7_CLAMG|nr:Transposon Ty3-I Gag-Pol poly [Clarias magur]
MAVEVDAAVEVPVGPGPSGQGTVSQVPMIDPGSSGPPYSEGPVRRTGRTTAGRHSNPNHLPRAVGRVASVEAVGAPSNSMSALFRPWVLGPPYWFIGK